MNSVPFLRERLSLVVITDPDCGGRELLDVVRQAVAGGAPSVQLRDKNAGGREMMELAHHLREVTRRTGALFFVNDRLDVALAASADGAHIGQSDIPLRDARRIVPSGFVIGLSVDSPKLAREAQRDGADYLGVGAIYGTPSKHDAGTPIGLEGLRAVREATELPIVAIGGIDTDNASEIRAAGADGLAVIRAVMQADDPARTVGVMKVAQVED